jgi:hypothetical protein
MLYGLLLWLAIICGCDAFTTSISGSAMTTSTTTAASHYSPMATSLSSSFFGSFEEFEDGDDDDEDDDDDDDDYEEMDGQSVAAFKAKMESKMGNILGETGGEEGGGMSSVDELINFARSQGATTEQPVTDWAHPATEIKAGVILVANPAKFCAGEGLFPSMMGGPSPSLLAKFGLTRPPPRDLGADRQADLLPILALVEREDKRGARGVLLNRRTGYLLGDLEQPATSFGGEQKDAASSSAGDGGGGVGPILEKFCIQPLWFGGIDNISSGLDMLHLCPTVQGADKLTEDGLYWGGDPAQAQEAMEDPSLDRVMTGFDFKFFVQSTIWSTRDLDREIKEGIWFPAVVSKEVLFKSRDRMGTRKAKPLWTEIMELMGGEFQKTKDEFYADEA